MLAVRWYGSKGHNIMLSFFDMYRNVCIGDRDIESLVYYRSGGLMHKSGPSSKLNSMFKNKKRKFSHRLPED